MNILKKSSTGRCEVTTYPFRLQHHLRGARHPTSIYCRASSSYTKLTNASLLSSAERVEFRFAGA
jgi:hypothetical protein